MFLSTGLSAVDVTISGPAGSGQFGMSVVALPNGHFVVVDPHFDASPSLTEVGAVHHYDGAWVKLATLRGSLPHDQVGSGGIEVLADGSYAVLNPDWDDTHAGNVGAITWCSSSTGMNATVSAANSLVGRTSGDRMGDSGFTRLPDGAMVLTCSAWDSPPLMDTGAVSRIASAARPTGVLAESACLIGASACDRIGSDGIVVLPGGAYLIASALWDNGTTRDAGAITWCAAGTFLSGTVSAANSIVGSSTEEEPVAARITVLANGHYAVSLSGWDNGPALDAGAVRWCDGTTATIGPFTPGNSLVGSTADDRIGSAGIIPLPNGNFIVVSPAWNLSSAIIEVGAVTWVNGSTGLIGAVSAANSLVGSSISDQAGSNGVTVLACPGNIWNYVVCTPGWNSSSNPNVGAVTWCSGSAGLTGEITATNSLTGTGSQNRAGEGGVVVLPQGNYMVISPLWDKGGRQNTGAVTRVDGVTGLTGAVTEGNSLTGVLAEDKIGSGGVVTLANGNVVVVSPRWSAMSGAVTWLPGGGSTGTMVTALNSLTGNVAGDRIGSGGVTALPNGHYVVRSPGWHYDLVPEAGAVTWMNGTIGSSGVVSLANSVTGSNGGDRVGDVQVRMLSTISSNYVINAPFWDRAGIVDAGAVAWCPGAAPSAGAMSEANALVGSTAYDQVGLSGITPLVGGAYLVNSRQWSANDVGAVTFGKAVGGISGEISNTNSLTGALADDRVGSAGSSALPGGRYVVHSLYLDRGTIPDTGALTLGSPGGSIGAINPANSQVGSMIRGHLKPFFMAGGKLVTGAPLGNRIVLMEPLEPQVEDGDSRHLGTVAAGSTSTLVVKYAGTGTPNATAPPVSIDGPDAGMFSVIGITGPGPDGFGTVTLSFTPVGPGPKLAALHIGSVDVALSGSGNLPTTFAGASLSTFNDTPLVLYHSKLFRGVVDPDGDTFSVTMAQMSAPGAAVQFRSDSFVYIPPAGFSGNDSFVITLTDSRGANSTATIQVAVSGPLGTGSNQPSMSTDKNSAGVITGVILTYQVIPFRSYEIERSADLNQWQVITVSAGDERGRLRHVDSTPLPSTAYYRLRTP